MWRPWGRTWPAPLVSEAGRRNGRQDFIVAHPSADPEARRGDHSRRLRVLGSEVLGCQLHLRPAVALEGRARSRDRHDAGHQDGRPARLLEF
jgi:hypothetical protein